MMWVNWTIKTKNQTNSVWEVQIIFLVNSLQQAVKACPLRFIALAWHESILIAIRKPLDIGTGFTPCFASLVRWCFWAIALARITARTPLVSRRGLRTHASSGDPGKVRRGLGKGARNTRKVVPYAQWKEVREVGRRGTGKERKRIRRR